jgi:hypothetical protein
MASISATGRYAYGKIYDAEAYHACTNMPRFGSKAILTEAQIKDLTALLMDPASRQSVTASAWAGATARSRAADLPHRRHQRTSDTIDSMAGFDTLPALVAWLACALAVVLAAVANRVNSCNMGVEDLVNQSWRGPTRWQGRRGGPPPRARPPARSNAAHPQAATRYLAVLATYETRAAYARFGS